MAKKPLTGKAKELQNYLQDHLAPLEVRLRLNRNRSTYLSGTKFEGVYTISVHRVFLEAPEEIWKLLGCFFVRATKKVKHGLEDYIHNLPPEVWQANSRRAPKVEAVGQAHNLKEALRRALELGFNNNYPRELPRIGWSPRSSSNGGVARLGSYDDAAHLIRITHRLDDEEVPFDFISSIVFHEMLHGIHRPEVREDRKRRIHTRAFLEAEKAYPHYAWAREWEKAHLDRILKRQRRRRRAQKK